VKVTLKYKEVARPLEKVILELTPEQARFIRFIAHSYANNIVGNTGIVAKSLWRSLDCVKDVDDDFNITFESKEIE
jgi:hypothetical protein